MKYIFLIAFLVLVSSLAVAAQQTPPLQINGIEVETTKAKVIQKLGKPSSSRKKTDGNECRGDLLRLRYPGLIIELEDGNSNKKTVIATATVTSSKWSVSGIKISASVSEVQKKFGDGESGKKNGLDYLRYYPGDGYADFIFQKGKLVRIYWEFNFC